MKIGIAGIGFVGGAVEHWFKLQGSAHEVVLYDKYKDIGSPDALGSADIVFVCVPTPFHEGSRGYDDSAVLETLSLLKAPQVAVLKSTILPGSTERFQKKFPGLKVLFNPEFLVAKTAKEDFLDPERQIVGYTEQSKAWAERVLALLPKAPYTKSMPATEAELVKYFGNTFLANRVIFANQFFDLCQKLGADYEIVKEAAGADSRIGTSHFNVMEDGYRGYAGACLQKDIKAFLGLAEEKGVDLSLLKEIDSINENLRKSDPNRLRVL